MSDLFTFTTEPVPAQTFTINGKEHTLRDIRHLSDEEEAAFRVLWKKNEVTTEKMTLAVNKRRDGTAQVFAKRLAQIRKDIICFMTDVPAEIVEMLNFSQQAQIVQEITAPGLARAIASATAEPETDPELAEADKELSEAEDDPEARALADDAAA